MIGFGILQVLLCLTVPVLGCYREKGFNPTMEDLFNATDIVVFGEDLEHFDVNTTMEMIPIATNSLFRVYCVLKSDGEEILEKITIESIFPRSSCSLTKHNVGDKVIVSLRRMESGNYEWHEVYQLQKAAYDANAENFNRTSSVLDPKRWVPPVDLQRNMCPSEYQDNSRLEKVQLETVTGNPDGSSTGTGDSVQLSTMSGSTMSVVSIVTDSQNETVTSEKVDIVSMKGTTRKHSSPVPSFPDNSKSENIKVGSVSSNNGENNGENGAAFKQTSTLVVFVVSCCIIFLNEFAFRV